MEDLSGYAMATAPNTPERAAPQMDELIEILAEQSHIGWAAEKQRQGYADHVFVVCALTDSRRACDDPDRCHIFGRGGCDLSKSQHHPDMLPYAELAEHIKKYDRVTVRGVLAGIEAAGYLISKRLSYTLTAAPSEERAP